MSAKSKMSFGPLAEDAPGRLVPYGDRPYYLPDELPPVGNLEFDAAFQTGLQRTMHQLGILDGISRETDASPVLYTSLIRREAVESVLVEGADVRLEDLFRPKEQALETGIARKDYREAANYERAIREWAEEVSDGETISAPLLKHLHETLLDGVRDQADHLGAYRQKPAFIPPPTGEAAPFVAPAPEKVPGLMENLLAFIDEPNTYHDLVEIGLVHYQFETIHPFGDGNGRLGRLLITLQLINRGHLTRPFIHPSAYFNEHKQEYVERMRAVSTDGEWEAWLAFFVEGIRQQAEAAVDRAGALRELRREYEHRFGSEKTAADRLAMRLFRDPYVTTTEVEEVLDVSYQTARNAITTLEAEGVLQETTGKERYQEYRAEDIFEVLNRPVGE